MAPERSDALAYGLLKTFKEELLHPLLYVNGAACELLGPQLLLVNWRQLPFSLA